MIPFLVEDWDADEEPLECVRYDLEGESEENFRRQVDVHLDLVMIASVAAAV